MDTNILMEIDGIQMELDSGIGLIAVIADGLSAFAQSSDLSGKSGQRYINALYLTFDSLSGTNGKLREQLEHAREHAS